MVRSSLFPLGVLSSPFWVAPSSPWLLQHVKVSFPRVLPLLHVVPFSSPQRLPISPDSSDNIAPSILSRHSKLIATDTSMSVFNSTVTLRISECGIVLEWFLALSLGSRGGQLSTKNHGFCRCEWSLVLAWGRKECQQFTSQALDHCSGLLVPYHTFLF